MSMLAERKRKEKWALNPRGKSWSSDKNKFGQRLLEKMGWSEGQGLGANNQGPTEIVKVRKKDDIKGLGFKEKGEEWLKTTSEFNELLDQLGSSQEENTDDQSDQTSSLEDRSKKSKARVHYPKFTRGKDLSRYSDKDLASIIGPEVVKNKSSEEKHSHYTSNQVNKGSSEDYFTQKKHSKNTTTAIENGVSTLTGSEEENLSMKKKKKTKSFNKVNNEENSSNNISADPNPEEDGSFISTEISKPVDESDENPEPQPMKKKKKKAKNDNEVNEENEENSPDTISADPTVNPVKKIKKQKRPPEEHCSIMSTEISKPADESDENPNPQPIKKKKKKTKNDNEVNNEENSSDTISSDPTVNPVEKIKKRKRPSEEHCSIVSTEISKPADESDENPDPLPIKKKKKKHQTENVNSESELKNKSTLVKKKKIVKSEQLETPMEEDEIPVKTSLKVPKKEKVKKSHAENEIQENNQVNCSKSNHDCLEVLGRKTRLKRIYNPNKGLSQDFETSEFLSLNSESQSKSDPSNLKDESDTSQQNINQVQQRTTMGNNSSLMHCHVNKTDLDIPKDVVDEEFRLLSKTFKFLKKKIPKDAGTKVVGHFSAAVRKRLTLLNRLRHMKTLIPKSHVEEVEAAVKVFSNKIEERNKILKFSYQIRDKISQLSSEVKEWENSRRGRNKEELSEATIPNLEQLYPIEQMMEQLLQMHAQFTKNLIPTEIENIKNCILIMAPIKPPQPMAASGLKEKDGETQVTGFDTQQTEYKDEELSKTLRIQTNNLNCLKLKLQKINGCDSSLSKQVTFKHRNGMKQGNSNQQCDSFSRKETFSHGFSKPDSSFRKPKSRNCSDFNNQETSIQSNNYCHVEDTFNDGYQSTEGYFKQSISQGTFNCGVSKRDSSLSRQGTPGNYNRKQTFNESTNNFNKQDTFNQNDGNFRRQGTFNKRDDNFYRQGTFSQRGRGGFTNTGRGCRGQLRGRNQHSFREEQVPEEVSQGTQDHHQSFRGPYHQQSFRGSYHQQSFRGSYHQQSFRGSYHQQSFCTQSAAPTRGSYRETFRGRGRGIMDRGRPRGRGRISQNNYDAKVYANKCKAENKIPELTFNGVDLKQILGYASDKPKED